MKKTSIENRIIIESGLLFFKHGIRSITMDQIASTLGISKKTIYQHYKDKESLVRSFTNLELFEQEKEMQLIRLQSIDAIDEMLKVMIHLENFFGRVNPSVFYDLQKYHPESWKSFTQFKEKILIGFVEENIKSGIKKELYRKELQIKLIARLRIEEVEMGMNPSIFPPNKFKLIDVQISLIDHFLHGIVTIKGFKLIQKYKKSFNHLS